MKYFPTKILILCILTPPILYILTVQAIEKNLKSRYTHEIEDIYIGDTQSLFEGSITIGDAISQNIDQYIKSKALLSLGVKSDITVTTNSNTIIYPNAFSPGDDPDQTHNPMQIAKENYAVLNEGFVIAVDVKVALDQFLSYAILSLYMLVSILVFLFYYRRGSLRADREADHIQEEIQGLLEKEQSHLERMEVLNDERDHLSSELRKIKQSFATEQKKASITEDEMFDEIVALEKKLEDNLNLQNEQQEETQALKEKILQYEKGILKSKKQAKKASDVTQKRFNTLYKNLIVHDRAVDGFVSLMPDLQLKAEEIILQLNDNPKLVPIKRKVFGKKNRETVFELLFSYKGRLYYRMRSDHKLEILSIGTKHTQSKDLTFLDQL